MQKYILLIAFMQCFQWLGAQPQAGRKVVIIINTEQKIPAQGATAELLVLLILLLYNLL